MNASTLPVDLKDPANLFKPCPFWSWNDLLDPEELRRQVREMHAAGLGGFFMHARGGLQTRYLSPEWMECVRACLDEAAKLGMEGWLYDENGWPSGFGGGLVNGLGVDYQQKYLAYEWLDADCAEQRDNTIAFYSPDGATLLGLQVPAGTAGRVLHCYFDVNPYYIDNLDPKVVEKFIEVTHQHYYAELPPELLGRMRGIFTDEPQLSRRGLLWSFVVEDAYRREYSRELLEELPLLFLDKPESGAMRIRFWRMVARMFAENFQKKVFDWCTRHHWQLTGHHVLEEEYSIQIASNGAIMPQYRYYHVPGMDHLSRSEPDVVAMMQVVSAAAQCGHRQILTESFALCGWNFNFYGMKWMYQIQMAHGVNFLCQHLQSYSLKGLRKRDYPGSWFFHQPWWGDYAHLNACFTRTGMLLAGGEIKSDVLVMHGISSGWALYNGDDYDDFINLYSGSLRLLSNLLSGYRVDYHYGDEQLLADLGSCDGSTVLIGSQRYRLVVFPQLSNLSRQAYELFVRYTAAGGRIIAVRNQIEPGRLTIDGAPLSDVEKTWFAGLEWVDNEYAASVLAAALVPRLAASENGAEALQLPAAVREFADLGGRKGRLYFIANRRYNLPAEVKLSFPEGGVLELIDPATGEFSGVPYRLDAAGHIEADYYFEPAASALFFVSQAGGVKPEVAVPPMRSAAPLLRLDDRPWEIAGGFTNFLTLDHCEFRVDGGAWEYDDVSVIQSRLLKLERPCRLEMRFGFHCGDGYDCGAPLKLIVETPELFEFKFNGVPFRAADAGYCFDKAFRVVELPSGQVRPGGNVIEMAMDYAQRPGVYAALRRAAQFETEYNMLAYDMEVEAVYLAGDFGVRGLGSRTVVSRHGCTGSTLSCGTGVATEAVRWYGGFELTAKPAAVGLKAVLDAGLPFFAGTLTLRREIELTGDQAEAVERFQFDLAGFNSLKLRVNGVDAGAAFWPPFVIPAAGMFRAGVNTVEIELTQSLRNLLGPFHLKKEGESGAVHTLSFNKETNVIGMPAPEYDEGYCFVRLAVDDPALS